MLICLAVAFRGLNEVPHGAAVTQPYALIGGGKKLTGND